MIASTVVRNGSESTSLAKRSIFDNVFSQGIQKSLPRVLKRSILI